ncbi:Phosphoserine phosphatase RsbU [Caulifigura coniformis]|uniref:Phosphoserine phosphatase RsbU n=1 Tax=Caulifigura coniformis TaxID=2527983 RepID=A0A517SMZ7_9PLAN|nr:GAF domain-containing SpoIIE family protein phosphatase [Caulifigura coniformis]QDT57498.1 Phosphoserine phosphatase RsbU [Caulifigura coniformis]
MAASWQNRLDDVFELMQEMSRGTDPQEMVRAYAKRVATIRQFDRRLSLSRRDTAHPEFHITRDSATEDEIDPWKEKHRLPRISGGQLADLLYEGKPVILNDFQAGEDDPAFDYLREYRSLMLIPMLDGGEALNALVLMKRDPQGFDHEDLPETFWITNLFGRATHNLVLKEQIRDAYEAVDRELKVVGKIQRSLLPRETPKIATLDLAAEYRTSTRAGGDYYDFFPLPDDRWGILVADVSGHGTPAAVMMAITHSIAHLYPNDAGHPGEMLEFVNRHLAGRYTSGIEAFVTAFYGIYNPATHDLTFASAGHNPPRWWKCGEQVARSIEGAASLPLGIDEDVKYGDHTIRLSKGDRIVFYTDGIVEATSPDGDMFRTDRIDEVLKNSCWQSAAEIRDRILSHLHDFTAGAPPIDDQTIVVASVLK